MFLSSPIIRLRADTTTTCLVWSWWLNPLTLGADEHPSFSATCANEPNIPLDTILSQLLSATCANEPDVLPFDTIFVVVSRRIIPWKVDLIRRLGGWSE